MDKQLSNEEALFFLKRFHGHIGPYVVLGYRAGLIANRELGSDPFSKRAVTFTGFKTPISCFTDGVQLGSCCTLGKGNITVEDKGEARVIFTAKDDSRAVEIKLSDETVSRIARADTWELSDRLGREMLAEPEEGLFIIKIDDRVQSARV
ncbi:formylmethanofuran dehydrogenase subunit E family protein [candidate division WOR-3 bacterium]|nr:formylmethanofuran dehydrogenase subunit E family protein [candidate division WOR-3 bacterium]